MHVSEEASRVRLDLGDFEVRAKVDTGDVVLDAGGERALLASNADALVALAGRVGVGEGDARRAGCALCGFVDMSCDRSVSKDCNDGYERCGMTYWQ